MRWRNLWQPVSSNELSTLLLLPTMLRSLIHPLRQAPQSRSATSGAGRSLRRQVMPHPILCSADSSHLGRSQSGVQLLPLCHWGGVLHQEGCAHPLFSAGLRRRLRSDEDEEAEMCCRRKVSCRRLCRRSESSDTESNTDV